MERAETLFNIPIKVIDNMPEGEAFIVSQTHDSNGNLKLLDCVKMVNLASKSAKSPQMKKG